MERGLSLSGRFRLAFMEATVGLGLVALAWRFQQLQRVQYDEHLRNARLNTIAVERSTAARGRFYDARGHLLVSNTPSYQVWVRPGEIEKLPDAEKLMARALEIPREEIDKKIQKALKKAPLEPLVLARVLTQHQLARSLSMLRDLKGVYVEASSHRRYHYDKSAAGVFGYMGEISEEELARRRGHSEYTARDMIGKTGLENFYDSTLRGTKGIENHAVDALGRSVNVTEEQAPVAGLDLHLTIDIELQLLAEKLLKEAITYPNGGAVVVMDPRTGRVKALASAPNFDPRPFARGIGVKEYEALMKDKSVPLLSRAFETSFSPGSTFKLVTSSAGLAEKLCTGDSHFYCGGSYEGHNCFVRSGHGNINFEQSLALSCDVVYYRMADQLGIDRLRKYCKAYGLGSATGIELPSEDTGLVPSPRYKKKYWHDQWYSGDNINMGVGQGFLLVTPLQMAVVTSAVANGGSVYKPYLVEKMMSQSGSLKWKNRPVPVRHLPVKPQMLAAIRRGMKGTVKYGTGAAAQIPGLEIAGKTGTVETNGQNHTWFVSFAPADKPELVVVVFLEKSGGFGGGKAAPIAKQIYMKYFHIEEPKPGEPSGASSPRGSAALAAGRAGVSGSSRPAQASGSSPARSGDAGSNQTRRAGSSNSSKARPAGASNSSQARPAEGLPAGASGSAQPHLSGTSSSQSAAAKKP